MMAGKTPLRALIFSKTCGYRHECIPTAIKALQDLGRTSGDFVTTASEDADEYFTTSALGQFDVVVLLHCIGDFLTDGQLSKLSTFLADGGGIVAIHGAAAGMAKSTWYGKMIGAHFDMHPDPEEGVVLVEGSNADHAILSGCGGHTKWKDEWYNFTSHPRTNKNLNVLLRGDVSSFKGGNMGDDHPLSWYQEFEGGRVYYTALGHFDEAYSDDWFMGQIHRAIIWASGSNKDRKR